MHVQTVLPPPAATRTRTTDVSAGTINRAGDLLDSHSPARNRLDQSVDEALAAVADETDLDGDLTDTVDLDARDRQLGWRVRALDDETGTIPHWLGVQTVVDGD